MHLPVASAHNEGMDGAFLEFFYTKITVCTTAATTMRDYYG